MGRSVYPLSADDYKQKAPSDDDYKQKAPSADDYKQKAFIEKNPFWWSKSEQKTTLLSGSDSLDSDLDLSALVLCHMVYSDSLKKGDKFEYNNITWVCTGVYTATRMSMVTTGKFSLWEGSTTGIGTIYAISVRGSITVSDWWTDFSILPVNIDVSGSKWPNCWTAVHQGYRDRVIGLMIKEGAGKNGEAVKEFLKKASSGPDTATLLITGHSLGGGTAEVFSQMLAQGINGLSKVPNVRVKVVTCGQPRVYTRHSKKVNLETSRYVNVEEKDGKTKIDLVPLIPPEFIWGSDGLQLKLKDGSVTKTNEGSFPSEKWALKADASQHSCKLYVQNIKQVTASASLT